MIKKKSLTYKKSGVNIDKGSYFVNRIKPIIKSTSNKSVLDGIGGFAATYSMPKKYKKPILVACTDGVGTKVKIATQMGNLRTIGVDLVAMCANDLICSFATPLFFLDYYAVNKIDIKNSLDIIRGIVSGCKKANMALVGGESAEMPSIYQKNEFDLAGFAVGITKKKYMLKPKTIKRKDVIIAFPSSGLHSNGYSLARALIFKKLKMSLDEKVGTQKLGSILLKKTIIYTKLFMEVRNKTKAFANITGGGMIENIPRVLPNECCAIIFKKKIKTLPIFELISNHIAEKEMFRVFNMGIGMVAIVERENVDYVLRKSNGYVIGEIKNTHKKKDIKII